ncbi:hypothetical protein EPA93_17600 [Ktedonosporobacter rubrisoli]|uniref:M50 family peptidase n=1 Tax=Ktedonosporobacter rubrisoli TaxID=2509675 RepID=A0A4P6JQK3_KTERU|nr:hypothetical protein [Ktedonosporobacter rubrisoli]QBD77708.1 hypothetical protein EPA93_17600 [Ktedonosporobacter rubrisoli]
MQEIVIFSEFIDQIIVDNFGKTPRYIAVSRNKKHIELSPLAYELLKKVAAGDSFSAIAQGVSTAGKAHVSADEVQKAYETIIAKIKKIDGDQQTRQKDFWLKFSLVPASRVQQFASLLTFLFQAPIAFSLLSALVILLACALKQGLSQIILQPDPLTLLLAYSLFLISLLMHEFGHSSACVKGGIKPSEIGLAVYLIFPVFYSDVSASWQLSRWRKVRVDTAGVYFQLCAAVLYLLIWLIARQPAFQLALAMILGSCLFSLNPFLKFDGYWVLSDLFGIANLYKQPAYLISYFYWTRIQKQKRTLRWSPATCVFILIYGLLKAGFWIYLLAFSLPFLWQTALSYPLLITHTFAHLQHSARLSLLTDLQSLVTGGLFLLLWGGGLGRLCFPTVIRFIKQGRARRAEIE